MIPVEKSMLRKNRKSINTKKVTTKSVVGTNKYANHSTEPITWEAELQMMLQEEILQTKVDNFWGLDKDHDDRQRERLLMGKEEQESMFQELVHKTLRQQLQWDIELQQEKKEQEEFLIYKKLSGMQLYLDMLYNSTSSDDFVNFVWSSESSMNINNSSTSVGPNSIAIQTIGHSYADNVGHSSNTMYDLFQNSLQESELTFNTRNSNKKSNTVSFQQGNSNEYDRSNTFGNSFGNSKKGTKMNTLANVHNMEVSDDIIKDRTLITPLQTSVHLDGLQKSRAIISEASFSFQKTLKRLNSTSVTDMAMSTFKAKDPTKSLRKNFEEQNQSMKQKSILSQISESFAAEVEIPVVQHMAEIDGHPLFKWDQIQLLQAVFSLLDTNKKNYLTEEELCGLTSNSNNVHSLLKYTVFWAPLKKKKWSFFESLLQNDTDATIESRSNSLPVLKRGLSKGPKSSEKHLFSGEQTFKRVSTFAVWETAANQLCQQTNVSLRHIRSHEQHEDVIRSIYGKSGTTSKGTTMNGSTAAIKPIAAVSSAPQLRLPLEREYYLSRKINIGDTVWGLHQHGILWLPAVVRSIKLVNNENTDSNSSKNSDSDSAYGHYVYELWYPLTEVDQQRARALTASKQLLALPSQQDVSKLHPKPFNTDRQACAYAFDMIDNTGAGSVSLFKLVAALLSPEFQQLVNTSLSLKIIFGNDGPTILSKTDSHYYSYTDNEVIPMLLPVFIDTFSIKVEESNSQTVTIGNNMMSLSDYISKSDFLEFCQAVVDVKMYSVVTI